MSVCSGGFHLVTRSWTEYEIKHMIKRYITDNLSVHVKLDRSSITGGNKIELKVELRVGDELVSMDDSVIIVD